MKPDEKLFKQLTEIRNRRNGEDIKQLVEKIVPEVEHKLAVKFDEIKYFPKRKQTIIYPGTVSSMEIGIQGVRIDAKRFDDDLEYAVKLLIVHEGLHLTGLHHDKDGYKLGYYSSTGKDKYTPKIVQKIFGGD